MSEPTARIFSRPVARSGAAGSCGWSDLRRFSQAPFRNGSRIRVIKLSVHTRQNRSLLPEGSRRVRQHPLVAVDNAETKQSSAAVMAPFPESATFGWVIGLVITVALVGCMVVGLVVRHWPRRH